MDNIVKIILHLVSQKSPKRKPIGLKNRFFSNRKHQKTFFKKIQKTNSQEKVSNWELQARRTFFPSKERDTL